jgi:hypothetical protein
VVRNTSVIDSNSRPTTAKSSGSGGSTDSYASNTSSMSKKDMMSSSNTTATAFRSTAGPVLTSEHVESQNTEIRKILLNSFDLIEVTLLTFVANMMRLCDEDVYMDS